MGTQLALNLITPLINKTQISLIVIENESLVDILHELSDDHMIFQHLKFSF
jgi:hypothetical protein